MKRGGSSVAEEGMRGKEGASFGIGIPHECPAASLDWFARDRSAPLRWSVTESPVRQRICGWGPTASAVLDNIYVKFSS